jgi:hypothetical protein
MRLLFTLLMLFAAGCSPGALTIAAADIPRYAAHERVLTTEGVSLSLDDGGAVQPIPLADGSFRVLARQSLPSAFGARDMVYLGARIDGTEAPDDLSTVRHIVQIEYGSTLAILGRRSGVRVHSAHVGGLRVTHTKKHRRGLGAAGIAGIVAGSAVAAAGLIGLGVYGLMQIEAGPNFGGLN